MDWVSAGHDSFSDGSGECIQQQLQSAQSWRDTDIRVETFIPIWPFYLYIKPKNTPLSACIIVLSLDTLTWRERLGLRLEVKRMRTASDVMEVHPSSSQSLRSSEADDDLTSSLQRSSDDLMTFCWGTQSWIARCLASQVWAARRNWVIANVTVVMTMSL